MSQHIVLIGGRKNMQKKYETTIKDLGYKAKVFIRKVPQFSKVIGSPAGMVIFNNNASHEMLNIGMKKAKQECIPVVICNNNSLCALNNALQELNERIDSQVNEMVISDLSKKA